MNNQLTFIPIGGVGDVTRNMYLYEWNEKILIVDCGLGFADETMLGVDLLLPDVSYLQNSNKKIVGMVLTHGHEDHIGALPFILPQLPSFPIFASPFTAALANEKLKEYDISAKVKTVDFNDEELIIEDFRINFIRVTHSVPDTSNLLIKTPLGTIYHGSDFKFDLTPFDNKKVEFHKIAKAGRDGVLCLMSDSLGSEKEGHTLSEKTLSDSFRKEMTQCRGKFIVTTYSSNISRFNQAIEVAKELNRVVCFVGRSLIKTKEVAKRLGYMKFDPGMEVTVDNLKNYNDKQLLLLIAGSQGQENSAMSRIANDEFSEIKFTKDDVVVFSSEQIPGNEVSVNSLIDTIAKKEARVIYPEVSENFHVSGHGSSLDIMLLMSLVSPKKMLPIGGTFRQMVAFKNLAKKQGYLDKDVFLIEDGQKVIFRENGVTLGEKLDIRNVYVDEISGEAVEHYVLRDRQKLSEGGIVVLILEIDSATGQIINSPQIIARGFSENDNKILNKELLIEFRKPMSKRGRVVNWIHIRKLISEIAERTIYRKLRRRPLVLPVVIEV